MLGFGGMFKASPLFLDANSAPMTGIFASYCVLTWIPSKPNVPAPPAEEVEVVAQTIPPDGAAGVRVGRDPIAVRQPMVQSASTPRAQSIWSSRRETFAAAAGRPIVHGPMPSVVGRIAVVDGMPMHGPGFTTAHAGDSRVCR